MDRLLKRNDLGIYLNHLKLTGEGAEIGVLRGDFSNQILSKWDGRMLAMIDSWQHIPGDGYVDGCNVDDLSQQKAFFATHMNTRSFKGRTRIIKAFSHEAARLFRDGQLDFVYIDANHAFRRCQEDLVLWWPKVREGGLFCGHDYWNGRGRDGTIFGVKRAVDQFAALQGRQVLQTNEGNSSTWYFQK